MKSNWKPVLLVLLIVGVCACSETTAPLSDAKGHILGIAPITEIFSDGWKTTAVVIQYDKAIDGSTLSPSDYSVITEVEGQDITRVYTNMAPAKAEKGLEGPYVILELSHDYIADIAGATRTEGITAVAPKGDGVAPNPIRQVGNISWDPTAHPATLISQNQGGNGKDVYVYQAGEIKTTSGDGYAAFENKDEAVANYWCINLVLDDILKPDYNDEVYGRLKYNIYFPLDYDEVKSYPAVVFMADEDAAGPRHADALTNGGLGAVVWSNPSEQAKNECIVIVPSYRGAIVDQKGEAVTGDRQGRLSDPYHGVLNMMDWLMEQIPNIDKDRVYVTGQGSGARAGIKMMLDRPHLFAAALLFAPDYDPGEMAKLTDANMWIVASEADELAGPSMGSCIDALEANGGAVSRAAWNGQASDGEFTGFVRDMISEGNPIKYSLFEKGTLVPEGLADDSANNRTYTWRKGYTIEGLRDWLFTQK